MMFDDYTLEDTMVCGLCGIDPVDVDSPIEACYTCSIEESMQELVGISEYLTEYDD